MCKDQTVERCRQPRGRLTLRNLVPIVTLTPALSFMWSIQGIFPLTILCVVWPLLCCRRPRLKHTIIVNYTLEALLSPSLSGCASVSYFMPFFTQKDEWCRCFCSFCSFCSAEKKHCLKQQYLACFFVRFSKHFCFCILGTLTSINLYVLGIT